MALEKYEHYKGPDISFSKLFFTLLPVTVEQYFAYSLVNVNASPSAGCLDETNNFLLWLFSDYVVTFKMVRKVLTDYGLY